LQTFKNDKESVDKSHSPFAGKGCCRARESSQTAPHQPIRKLQNGFDFADGGCTFLLSGLGSVLLHQVSFFLTGP
jgi:hypothetical protein